MALAECQHCGRTFEVTDNFIGGLVPCTGCGKVAEVAGLRDPLWKALKALGAAVALGGGLWSGYEHGPVIGVAVAIVILAGIWLVSRAM